MMSEASLPHLYDHFLAPSVRSTRPAFSHRVSSKLSTHTLKGEPQAYSKDTAMCYKFTFKLECQRWYCSTRIPIRTDYRHCRHARHFGLRFGTCAALIHSPHYGGDPAAASSRDPTLYAPGAYRKTEPYIQQNTQQNTQQLG